MSPLDKLKEKIMSNLNNNHSSSFLNLISIDLDKFVYHNDSFGFDVGDNTLHEILIALQGIASRYEAEFLRTGGDEFMGFSFSNSDKEHSELGAAVHQGISDLKIQYVTEDYSDGDFVFSSYVSASVVAHGIFLERDVKKLPVMVGISVEKYFRDIDRAMYELKLTGKNKFLSASF